MTLPIAKSRYKQHFAADRKLACIKIRLSYVLTVINVIPFFPRMYAVTQA